MINNDFDILRDIDRRMASLQSQTERQFSSLQRVIALLSQETRFHRSQIERRLDILEEDHKAEMRKPPVMDLNSLGQNLWVKLAILVALLTGNTQLIDAIKAALKP